jgi:hypothetical protein
MKKIMTLMLGLALVMGTTATAFGGDTTMAKKHGKKKGKKGEKKNFQR